LAKQLLLLLLLLLPLADAGSSPLPVWKQVLLAASACQ
jgi:hypothetical protein